MNEDLKGIDGARAIYDEAVGRIKPVATVLAFSGGDDSNTTFQVARELGIRIDFLLHVNTRTGIGETTEFVRSFAAHTGVRYVEADAGSSYEDYVARKGFFGRGRKAHTYAYHLLKAQHLRSAISRHIRRGRRGVPVLLLNGARVEESDNRAKNFAGKYVRPDPSAPSNVWVNLIHHWSKVECKAYLSGCGARRNPVAELLCRSGECMCGTMQSDEARREASYWYPRWGRWLDALERRVVEKFPWGWGANIPRSFALEQAGQQRFPDFQPMCASCVVRPAVEPIITRTL